MPCPILCVSYARLCPHKLCTTVSTPAVHYCVYTSFVLASLHVCCAQQRVHTRYKRHCLHSHAFPHPQVVGRIKDKARVLNAPHLTRNRPPSANPDPISDHNSDLLGKGEAPGSRGSEEEATRRRGVSYHNSSTTLRQ